MWSSCEEGPGVAGNNTGAEPAISFNVTSFCGPSTASIPTFKSPYIKRSRTVHLKSLEKRNPTRTYRSLSFDGFQTCLNHRSFGWLTGKNSNSDTARPADRSFQCDTSRHRLKHSNASAIA